jgi:replicative DNA helicase
MRLSAPVYILKQHARALSRREKIPLHQALDRIANREGFGTWSLLAARRSEREPPATLFSQLSPGNLVLLGGRPRQGKTLVGIGLAVESLSRGNSSAFFTLEFTEADVARCFHLFDRNLESFGDRLLIDTSDRISAAHVIAQLGSAPANMLVVIDYLQLLDQRRENPSLMDQVTALKRFARKRRSIIVCLSQIDRRYDPASKPCPDLADVRMPNRLDLMLFDKACFLHGGNMQVADASRGSARVRK